MKDVYLGTSPLKSTEKTVKGQFVDIHHETFYKISNVDLMDDFFMTIVSDSDHWMFLSSNGSLSAGRKDRDNSLFPYYTVDKIHDYKGITGSNTQCLVEMDGKSFLWEPFTDRSRKIYHVERNLLKSIYGNKVIFEEINVELGLSFRYGWYNSEKFGWVRKSTLENISDSPLNVRVLDGIQNMLPAGVDYLFQNEYSNLADAYKKNERLEGSNLGLYMLSSIPVDKAEPSESLRATTVWYHGEIEPASILLSNKQKEAFERGAELTTETDVRASRGAYLVELPVHLDEKEVAEWYIISEINQDSGDVNDLDNFIQTASNLRESIEEDISEGTRNLTSKVAASDGMQTTADDLCSARHFSNTLFNIMRGGIFVNNYFIDKHDFLLFINQSNRSLVEKVRNHLGDLPEKPTYQDLVKWAALTENSDIQRLSIEYLPLTFSRRHGDPSRPWNQFSIEIKNEDGTDQLNYQGNWRDIFQNWEALGLSYPAFFEGMISRFLNASTADGYNPYRITREGVDWESPDPDDPWAYIGYWGDHQIIYLQKLLEHANQYFPGRLGEMLTSDNFVFIDVPYRIKSFGEIVSHPQDTIDFDHDLNHQLLKRAAENGADGRLLTTAGGQLCRANMLEKILITVLSKLSNFIPEAGIWLTTQRPEWNDANNALVGNGVSMVTLYYIRRFLNFWIELLEKHAEISVDLSEEVASHLETTNAVFHEFREYLASGFDDTQRYAITSKLGIAGEQYRNRVYEHALSTSRKKTEIKSILSFFRIALEFTDQSIVKNRRPDNLYHAYNLVSFKEKKAKIRHLYEMLEGQVAVLSAGSLSASESLDVLDGIKTSKLFRSDQYSYLLYPDRKLPRFTEKNNIPEESVKRSPLLQKLLEDKNRDIILKDNSGKYHFNSDFRNAALLKESLNELPGDIYGTMVKEQSDDILAIYEEIFDHQSFTGRSGTFYGYEGLGSIYWHMVSKLLLATGETYYKAIEENASAEITGRIKEHYYEIKAGIGLYKSPAIYGAFPTDAYSHTPGGKGVKQPGLTGQVKEDVISRFAELGVRVSNGRIGLVDSLINPEELNKSEKVFEYIDIQGTSRSLTLKADQIAFTFCQVPVIYTFNSEKAITVELSDGNKKSIEGNWMDQEHSAKVFQRTGDVVAIHCML